MSNGCTDMRKTDRKGLDSAGDGAVMEVLQHERKATYAV